MLANGGTREVQKIRLGNAHNLSEPPACELYISSLRRVRFKRKSTGFRAETLDLNFCLLVIIKDRYLQVL